MTDKNYIADFGSAENVNDIIEKNISGGNMILMYTDRFECCVQKKIEDTAHLLEARIFTEKAEIKIMRPTKENDSLCNIQRNRRKNRSGNGRHYY